MNNVIQVKLKQSRTHVDHPNNQIIDLRLGMYNIFYMLQKNILPVLV